MAARTLAWISTQRNCPVTNEELCGLVESIAARRDRDAFAQLFRHFAPRLKGFGMRRGTDAASSEELAQETMLTVWRKADTFDPRRATVSTWIFTIVRNKRIDLFRREGHPDAELSEATEAAYEGRAADDELTLAEWGSVLRQALTELPEDQVTVLKKAFFEDKSHSVIAEELGLPLGTVKSRIRLALARLRNALPEDCQ
ncbi:MAG: sigma-70 family RNA polymerase sigma factor [Rhodospirillales bacterium]|nr:sigma-70 family RNA polymerase sigma factor [Rhodospirillales bacterium]